MDFWEKYKKNKKKLNVFSAIGGAAIKIHGNMKILDQCRRTTKFFIARRRCRSSTRKYGRFWKSNKIK
jgi:hypothetical protein